MARPEQLREEPPATFTVRGLLLFVAICGLGIGVVAAPLMRARIVSNETAAIGTLRTLSTSEAGFQSAAMVDQDGDGSGEFGWLQELAGTSGYRLQGGGLSMAPASPAFITSVLGTTAGKNTGVAQKSGYSFHVFLPTAAGPAVGEAVPVPMFPKQTPTTRQSRWPGPPTDANAQEVRFVCYAWPQSLGRSGKRAFVVSQQGEVFATGNEGAQEYAGTAALPPPFSPAAAFVALGKRERWQWGRRGSERVPLPLGEADRRAEDPRNLEGQFWAPARAADGYFWVPAGN